MDYLNCNVFVSVTTLPCRIDSLLQLSLNSIFNQTLLPDKIFICIPEYSKREKKRYVIPDFLSKLPLCKIIQTKQDFGPATKLLPVLLYEKNPDSIIITIDDDIIYDKYIIEKLLKQ